jgi:hypothetical protein
MSIFGLRFQGLLALALTMVVSGGCKAPDPEPPFATTAATIKDLMLSIIDTNADVVWLSVSTVHSEKGTIETQPRTDEEWAAVRHGALALAEASNLLMMPGRRVARPGEKSETPGVELEPEEMDVLINKDRNAWNARAKELHDAAMAVLAAAEARNAEKVFELGDGIERACENCHSQYWYPNEVKPGPVTINSASGS